MNNLARGIVVPCLVAAIASIAVHAVQAKSPSLSGGGFGGAKLEIAQGKYQQAIKTLAEAVRSDPNNAEAHLLLGQAYLKARRFEDSRDELRLAMRLGKGSSISQTANRSMMLLPGRVLAPISGDKSRFVTAALQLMFLQRGMPVADGKKPVVMNFYAPWEESCQKLEPIMDQAKIDYADRINFVTINTDDPINNKIMDQYGVSVVPTVIFLDPKGKLATYAIGPTGKNGIESEIKQLL